MRKMWDWSMCMILMTAFGDKRGLILYLNLILRWRRWRNLPVLTGHWSVSMQRLQSMDQDGFEVAFADAVEKRIAAETKQRLAELKVEAERDSDVD